MKIIQKIASLTWCICMMSIAAYGQIITGNSEPIQMNFGFPKLEIQDDLSFDDENNNNNIDPGEGTMISFTIKNVGEYAARGVSIEPLELNGIDGLLLPEGIEVGDILPGKSQLVRVGIAAQGSLEKGTASLFFRILENGLYDNISVTYSVGTAQQQ